MSLLKHDIMEPVRSGLAETDRILREELFVDDSASVSRLMDHIGQFIDEYCEVRAEFIASGTSLYQAYRQTSPSSHITQQSFGSALRRRGFERRRITSGPDKAKHAWKGLRLRNGRLGRRVRRCGNVCI